MSANVTTSISNSGGLVSPQTNDPSHERTFKQVLRQINATLPEIITENKLNISLEGKNLQKSAQFFDVFKVVLDKLTEKIIQNKEVLLQISLLI